MTPQERQLIDDLFDRLAKLENTPRDPEAMSAIMQGLRGAPNAVYALVQTALVQDEALKRANDRIQQLEGGHAGEQNQPGGFLDSMRDTIFGQSQPRGSVPNVRSPGMGGRPVWNSGEVVQQTQGQQGPGQYGQPGYGQQPAYGQPQQQPPFGGGGGGSFLGTAAAAAAGVVGGSMLLGSIRSMMGGGGNQQAAFGGDTGGHRGSVEDRRPGGSDQSGGDLAREAGANDIGSSGSSRTGLFDNTSNDDNYDDMDHDSDGFDGDGGGDDD
ncbi:MULTISPECIES: DUF2076 domain-containing protein [unclassified Bradyrhizobium]|uniref:DUF2076 domain-containing protein n=1 Tax=unclassified Bradyrhizobium TaxID=2631580 RepID=UPI001BAC503F|nr:MULTISPECIES: DUF2076 domain-containing protein [unclassified Bradyrhizobium]MBR1229615.1 DUF2076 domain-containing protein [Bradyrhizobium sp. AUGA SZCCT0176]MBR1232456.1 DUF2076 domain-containing protein [Bradyrhizobium sp. AUGA SZCCT0182]MBR1300157.1 DUF2076 domain-containing protein [Bradyrhizobium sp. AUGA SZCCT0042]